LFQDFWKKNQRFSIQVSLSNDVLPKK